jgi:hypothetical protein
VSVWVLDLDDFKTLPKNEKEQLFDIFRKDIRALREMSHPFVLRVHDVSPSVGILCFCSVLGDGRYGIWSFSMVI